jgi:peptidoglycan/LPS O-acetylase OafA/YrhL
MPTVAEVTAPDPKASAWGIAPKANAIGFLRLTFALFVVIGHVYPLGGLGTDPISLVSGRQEQLNSIGLWGFFVLSGYLIASSSERSGTILRFMWHRVLRIFPGYWVCLTVTAFVFGSLMWTLEHGELSSFLSIDPLSYVISNAALYIRQPGLPGLLVDQPLAYYLNGSLWTLLPEFVCYIVLGIAGFLGWLRPRVALAVFVTLVVLAFFKSDQRTFTYFAAGVAAYMWRDRLNLADGRLALIASGWLLASVVLGLYWWLGIVPLAYLVLFAAARLPFRDVGRKFDLSYGVYIYAFPTQQLLGLAGVPTLGVAPYFVATLSVVLPLALASWVLVESPALRLKGFHPKPAH